MGKFLQHWEDDKISDRNTAQMNMWCDYALVHCFVQFGWAFKSKSLAHIILFQSIFKFQIPSYSVSNIFTCNARSNVMCKKSMRFIKFRYRRSKKKHQRERYHWKEKKLVIILKKFASKIWNPIEGKILLFKTLI